MLNQKITAKKIVKLLLSDSIKNYYLSTIIMHLELKIIKYCPTRVPNRFICK